MKKNLYNHTVQILIFVLTSSYSINTFSSSTSVAPLTTRSTGYLIYNYGLGENNSPVKSTGAAKTLAEGSKTACANCHRRSGYGTSEGGLLVPPVTSHHLFSEREFNYREIKRNTTRPITRHAYTTESLKRAIREGIDANGRRLDQVMPRYSLSDTEAEQLVDYLSSLGNDKTDGIEDSTIHIATIITDETEDGLVKSHLDTLQTFITTKNAETRLEGRRKENTPWHKQWSYSSYRKWQLHVWKLTGKPDKWKKQLTDYYHARPVFSVVGGISDNEWAPVHKFCESIHLPCLFPTTNKPDITHSNIYNLYFSRGLFLESDVIAKQITHLSGRINIIQIIDDNLANIAAAERTHKHLLTRPHISVSNYHVNEANNIESIINTPDSPHHATQLIFWSEAGKLLPAFENYSGKISAIYTSSENLRQTDNFTSKIPLYITHRHLLNNQRKQKLLRLQYWLKSHKLEIHDINSAANAYFAVNIFNKALRHLRNNFSREYLIERIEHIVENAPFKANFSSLSLGSDQRFASKGSYLIGPLFNSREFQSDTVAARWIVPDI